VQINLNKITVLRIRTKIYLFGGRATPSLDQVIVYDNVSNSWSNETIMPLGVDACGIINYENNIILVGGYRNDIASGLYINSTRQYNTVNKEWNTLAPIPATVNTAYIELVLSNDKIYAQLYDKYFIYNILNNNWTQKNNPQHLEVKSQLVNIDNKIYSCGRYIELYNEIENSWSILGKLPIPETTELKEYKAIAFDGLIYVLIETVHINISSYKWYFYIFNTQNNSWSELIPPSLPENSFAFNLCKSKDEIFILGGASGKSLFDGSHPTYNINYSFTPPKLLYIQSKTDK